MKFSFRWETTVFLFVVQIEWKLDIICKIKNKIDFIRENFFVFFVVFIFFENLRVNYLRELGKIYSYKSKTMKKMEKLHRRKYFYFYILHIITKFQQNWQSFKFCPMRGGPFTPPSPIWGVSNAPKTLIFFPEVRPYPRIKLHYKTKNGKIWPFLMGRST